MTARSGPRRILVCPQEFKGSLTAIEAAAAIAAGVRAVLSDAEVTELPMADGGPGTVAIVARATGATLVRHLATGPLGDTIEATYALIERAGAPTLAVIETAATAGLVLVPAARRDPARATSRGVGEQILDALARGARQVIVGVGGTGTNDGGAGAAQALGVRLLDASGDAMPSGGRALSQLARATATEDAALRDLDLRIAVDVQNTLLGPAGATAVYGAQKGVTDWQAPALESALARWAARLLDDLHLDVASMPGSGAGGGLPAGLLAACPRGRIESGAALVADAIGLPEAIATADLVITGEGALDAQTAYGKSVAHVAALAAAAGTPCLAVAGIVEGLPTGIIDAEPLACTEGDRANAIAHAGDHVTAATMRLLRRYLERT